MKKILLLIGLIGLAHLPATKANGSLDVHFQTPTEAVWKTSSGQSVTVTRLSFLLSQFRLHTLDGRTVELPGQYASVDLINQHPDFNLTNVPPALYHDLQFTVGLDEDINQADPARWPATHPLNPLVNNLHWSWQGGYVFFALEGHYNDNAGYSLHLAHSTNQTVITLPFQGGSRIDLHLDIARLFQNIDFSQNAAATHSRDGDPLAVAFRKNLSTSFGVALHPKMTLATVTSSPAMHLLIAKNATPFRLRIPAGFPIPTLPADNPITEEGVDLGRHLFHERLLSHDNSQSCGSCHKPQDAFSDSPRRFSVGVDKQEGTRNSMALFNLAWKKRFFWDGRAASLRQQVLMPIQDAKEMHQSLGTAVDKLNNDPRYPVEFEKAFGSRLINSDRIARALEQFLLTIVTHDSKFDRSLRGDDELTQQEKRGFELFSTEYDPRRGLTGADCFHCHGGPLFSDYRFLNNGLPGVTNQFAVPSLRNVAVTAPYMHDGRFKTLTEVIDHYTSGVQRTPNLDPNLAKHPTSGLPLTEEDKRALIAFLKTLTDARYEDRFARAP